MARKTMAKVSNTRERVSATGGKSRGNMRAKKFTALSKESTIVAISMPSAPTDHTPPTTKAIMTSAAARLDPAGRGRTGTSRTSGGASVSMDISG
ncbi:MAG: hypothetical protein ACTH31_16725 [Pseudoclavibacter sp.]